MNLDQPSIEESNRILSDIFQFHPLTVEDCQSIGYQTPKIDDFGTYIFIITHALPPNAKLITHETPIELNIFLGSNYIVTSYYDEDMPPIRNIQNKLGKDERLIQNGPDFLCHAILDKLVDDYMPLIDDLDDHLDLLETRVIDKPSPDILEELLDQKHALMALRRIISPLREILNRLSRDDFPMIDRRTRIYYRDIYDHLVRIQDLVESLRDLASGILDVYLNSTSMRLNEVMKALTVVSTIFLPLSFVAGIYGMNFEYMPELSWRYGYLFVWLIFLSIFFGMLLWFRRRNWF